MSALLLAGSGLPLQAAAKPVNPSDDGPVILPAFVVAAPRNEGGSHWRYLGHPDFEILSNGADKLAQQMAEQLPVCLQILDLIVPPTLRLHFKTPLMIILDDRAPVAALPGFDDFQGYRAPPNVVARYFRHYADPGAFIAYVNVHGDEMQPVQAPSPATVIVFNQLLPLTLSRSGLLPERFWLIDSVAQFFTFPRVERGRFRLNAAFLNEPNESTSVPALLPLGQLFETLARRSRTPAGDSGVTFVSRGGPSSLNVRSLPPEIQERKIAYFTERLFVRWAWLADGGKYRPLFWNFYLRASLSPDAGEPLFQECFGLTYAEASRLIQTYRQEKARQPAEIDFRKSLTAPQRAEPIRDATSAEIARLTGEWSRLAAPTLPRLKSSLLASATRGFERELKKNTAPDPRFLASAGLTFAEVSRDREALSLLEAAAKTALIHPRVALEIARIRLDAARDSANARGAMAKLSSAEVQTVLEPLAIAYGQSHQLEQFYALVARVWESTDLKPERDQLAPLLEGARLFPHNGELAWRAAQLYARAGFTAEAEGLCARALAFAPEESVREKLTSLRQSLSPP